MVGYKYLIIGGGLAADAATRGIRELDRDGSIGLLSREPYPPYLRPNLSKGLWKGRPIEKIWRHTDQLGVDIHLNREVVHLDPARKLIRDAEGEEIGFEKLLLATGGSPIRLPFGGEEIIYFRSLRDYYRLRELSERRERFLIIGGGFIGSEIAAALAMNGKQVTMVFMEDAIGGLIFPTGLAQFLNEYYRAKGVEVIPNDAVAGVERHGENIRVQTKSGRTLEVDGVVAGIGIRPNVSLAEDASLEVDNGIVVDDLLRTSHPDIYAAGDVANFFHVGLGRRVRIEHEDNAIRMGFHAGRNMAGAGEVYDHIPMFYSDLFDLGYEAVGELNSKLRIVEDWREPHKKGVLYYLEDSRVRGVLLWNVWDTVPAARKLLTEPGPVDPVQLVGKLM